MITNKELSIDFAQVLEANPRLEDYLKEEFATNHADGVLDDDMPKAFETWLERLTPEAWTELEKQFKTHNETLS